MFENCTQLVNDDMAISIAIFSLTGVSIHEKESRYFEDVCSDEASQDRTTALNVNDVCRSEESEVVHEKRNKVMILNLEMIKILLKNDSVSSTYENEKVDGMKINKEIMTD
jgi:hypothetical protein